MLPHRLKEARVKKGISQQKLGVLAGIDEATASARMNQYERGIHVPDFELVCRIAEVLTFLPAFSIPWKMSWPFRSACGMLRVKKRNSRPRPALQPLIITPPFLS